MLVSIIIPTYNTALLIERALHSVLRQKGNVEFEILCVDDCSTDNTVAVIEALHDSRIRIFRQEHNQGPAAARNRGLQEAKGDFCAFLDGDDYWKPDFLAETSAFLQTHPECVAVSVMQCHKIIGKPPAVAPSNTGVEQPIVLEDFFVFWAKYNHVCTGSVLMRTDIARNAGGQREDLRICEDLEFWALLATRGQWGFIPKVLFTSDGGSVTQKQGWLEKNIRRWNSAPSIEEWMKRFADTPCAQSEAFLCCIGRIVRNICYCHIMTDRWSLARKEVQQYGRVFPKNRYNTLFKLAAKNYFSWSVWCFLLKFREFRRKLGK